jgi:N-acetyl-anhydromuramyl-L-alanine amidase AmpD
MVQIVKKQITRNFTDGNFAKKYIAIHETDNESAGADAMAHFNFYNNHPEAECSTTFVVDDKVAVQMMDIEDKSWAIGVIYGNPRNVTDATNANSINIEICVNKDGDYAKARQNAIELVKYLMALTGIPASRVIRHYDACLKWCPRRMLDNPKLWVDFKEQLDGQAPIVTLPNPTPISPTVANNSIKDLQADLNRLGFRGQNGLQLTVDGLKGTNTVHATKVFQGVMGLVQDGIAGSMTMAAINQIFSKPLDGVPYPHYEYATRYIQYRVGARVDGVFGSGTAIAVKAWQAKNGLVADGVVGSNSWAKLIG